MTTAAEMSVEEAIRVVLGNKLAESITASQGMHWAFVAAVSSARTDDDPRALAAIDKELKRQKALA